LPDINATIDDLSMVIKPTGEGEWNNVQTELFFDQGQVVMEVNGLSYVGRGRITDPTTGSQETITINAQLDLC